jgi:hypothetical protein
MGQDSKREDYLIKNNMSEEDDVVGGAIETPIAFVISGVFEEDTTSGLGCQFVGSLSRKVHIANTVEHTRIALHGRWFCR